MTAPTQDQIERKALLDTCSGLIDKNAHVRTLGIAYINSELATQTAQALLNILMHKGIISPNELRAALADSYRTRNAQLSESGMIKPNGGG